MAEPNVQRRNPGQAQPQPVLAPNWWLGLVPRELWDRKKTPFIYEQDFIPLGATTTTVGNIQIQADSHFLCIGAVHLITDVTNTTVLDSPSTANSTGILALITDVGSGMPLSQVPVPIESIFGTAQLPAIWAIPKLFPASGTIATQVQNLLATARNVRLSYWGVRIYPNIPETAP